MIVSNIGVVPDFSALYTTNAGPYTATVQVALTDEHKVSSFAYMDKVRSGLARNYPEIRTFFSSGSMVDAILNSGMPAPVDLQFASSNLPLVYGMAEDVAARIRRLPGVGEVYIPQDMNYPSLRLNVDRVHAGELGLSQKDVIDNVITALNSNLMIAPNYWVDYKTGNDYFMTVQYYEHGQPAIHNSLDLSNIPLRAPNLKTPTTLDTVVNIDRIEDAHGVRSLRHPARRRGLCDARRRRPGNVEDQYRQDHGRRQNSRRRHLHDARHGARHGGILQAIRDRVRHLLRAAFPHSGGPVPLLHRSLPDHAGDSHGIHRRADHSAAGAQHAQRDVADGRADADRHRRFEQHSDCRFRSQSGRARASR